MATHSTVVGYILWFFGGVLGLHRFYFGKRTTGVVYFLTLGLLGVGWLIDAFLIGSMKRQMATRYQAGRYNYSVGWLLLVVVGVLGFHRFYVGRWGTGLIYLCTAGLAGIGVLYDFLTFNELLSETNERWISGDAELGVS
jgi:TM2 domain-containing membrane protein YozV